MIDQEIKAASAERLRKFRTRRALREEVFYLGREAYDKRWRAKVARERARAAQRKGRGAAIPTRPAPEHCENCGRLPGKRILHLDHDHKTGKFRGWLCHSCNVGLGHLGDSIASVQSAIAYLIRNESS
jgi:hypothetical protein